VQWVNRIILGDTLSVLKQMPSDFVDTIITSPPYYGLRFYGEETKVIWGGDKNCKHEWGPEIPREYHKAGETNPGKEGYTKNAGAWGQSSGQFCQKCGAWLGQLGLEPSLDLFIDHLLEITKELKRILKPTGVMFWNHGDCYGGNSSRASQGGRAGFGTPREGVFNIPMPGKCLALQNYRLILKMVDDQGWILRNQIIWYKSNHMPSSVKDRFTNAYEPVFMLVKNNEPVYYYNIETNLMVDRKPKELKEGEDWGWRVCLRCNGTGRIKDEICERCEGTGKIKHSFWRSLVYWFDLDAVRRPLKQVSIERLQRGVSDHHKYSETLNMGGGGGLNAPRPNIRRTKIPEEQAELYGSPRARYYRNTKLTSQNYERSMISLSKREQLEGKKWEATKGANPGDVWTIPTQPFKGSHFAVFPEKLVEQAILAGSPVQVCKKCGKARMRITKPSEDYEKHLGNWHARDRSGKGSLDGGFLTGNTKGGKRITADYQTIGWTDCDCPDDGDKYRPGIVLDPFMGSGTTALVALKLRRDFIGIEKNPEYVKIAYERIRPELEKQKLF